MNDEQEIDIMDLLRREILPYWPIILLSGLIGLLISYGVILYMQPVYISEAKIMFRDKNRNQTQQVLTELIGSGGLGQAQDKTKQNLEILQGDEVANFTLDKLQLNAELYKVENIISRPVYKKAPKFSVIYFQPDSIKPFDQNLFYDQSNSKLFFGKDELRINQKSFLGGNELLLSMDPKEVVKLISGDYKLKLYSNFELKKMINELKVTENKSRPSVDLSFRTNHPSKSQDLLKSMLEAYDRISIKDNKNEAVSTINFIDDRIFLIENELDSVESGIEQFKKANPYVVLSEAGSEILKDIKESDQKLAEVELQLSLLKDIDAYLQGRGKRPGMLPSFAGMDFGKEMQEFMEKLYEAEIEHEKIKTTTASKSEQYILSEELIKTLKGTISEFSINVRKNLLTMQGQAEKVAGRYNRLISSLPTQERKLFDINRQQVVKNELFTFLLQKREESALGAAATISDLIVLDPPSYNPTPTNIRPILFYAAGGFGGIGFLLMLLFARSFLNNKLGSRNQLETLTNLPVLGTIAMHHEESPLIMANQSRSVVSEQIRALRTNLGYYTNEITAGLTIVVSSSIPGEGKSFTASNIALAFSLTGERTLLIENDLRKPNVSKHFNISRRYGLSNYLAGKTDWEDMVVGTGYDNLFLMSSGPIPPNPVELIIGFRYGKMLKEAKETYKYIVIDCPPIGVVTDAELVAKHADLMVFVARFDYTPTDFIKNLLNRYQAEKKIISTGIVFNGVKPKGIGYYGSKYSYGYGYGYGQNYGYGYYGNEKKKVNIINRILNLF